MNVGHASGGAREADQHPRRQRDRGRERLRPVDEHGSWRRIVHVQFAGDAGPRISEGEAGEHVPNSAIGCLE